MNLLSYKNLIENLPYKIVKFAPKFENETLKSSDSSLL